MQAIKIKTQRETKQMTLNKLNVLIFPPSPSSGKTLPFWSLFCIEVTINYIIAACLEWKLFLALNCRQHTFLRKHEIIFKSKHKTL